VRQLSPGSDFPIISTEVQEGKDTNLAPGKDLRLNLILPSSTVNYGRRPPAFINATRKFISPPEELNVLALTRHISSLCYYVIWSFRMGLSGSPPICWPCLERFRPHVDPELAVCHSRPGFTYPLFFHILPVTFARSEDPRLFISSIAGLFCKITGAVFR